MTSDSDSNDELPYGSLIDLKIEDRVYRGVLMPSHRFSQEDILTLKLDNGYNIGLKKSDDMEITVLEEPKDIHREEDKPKKEEGLPKISILATGGTIASYVDYHTGAVHPAQSAEEMIYANPELADRCVPEVDVLLSKLSEDIKPQEWEMIAERVVEEFRSGSEGVIIAHGTDTMGYTSAALSFLLEDLPGPVVLVGSQRSSDRPSSDAHLNLLAAVEMAKSDVSGVYVVMHQDLNDRRCSVHLGTKVRKMHTSKRDAFRSINCEPVGWIDPLKEKVELKELPDRKDTEPKIRGGIVKDVAMIYVHPGMDEKVILQTSGSKGVVLIGTGLGHIPTDLISSVEKITDDGTPVVITSQCLYGTVNCNVYSSGRKLKEAGVISGRDMLPETALVKLMWTLSREEDTRAIMEKNIAGEFSERRWV